MQRQTLCNHSLRLENNYCFVIFYSTCWNIELINLVTRRPYVVYASFVFNGQRITQDHIAICGKIHYVKKDQTSIG